MRNAITTLLACIRDSLDDIEQSVGILTDAELDTPSTVPALTALNAAMENAEAAFVAVKATMELADKEQETA